MPPGLIFLAGLALVAINGFVYGVMREHSVYQYFYPPGVFWAVEGAFMAVVAVGAYIIYKSIEKDDADWESAKQKRKKKLDIEGVNSEGVIEDLKQHGASSFSTSISAIVKVTPDYSAQFHTEVYIGSVKNIYLSQFQPGTKIEVRYVSSDPSISEFIGIVGQTKDYREEAAQ